MLATPTPQRSARRVPTTAQPAAGQASLEDLLAAMAEEARRGTPARLAANEVLRRLPPDPAATAELVRFGLISQANAGAASSRTLIARAEDEAPPPAQGTSTPAAVAAQYQHRGPTPAQRRDALLLALEGADGTVKPLLAFTLVDIERFRAICAGQLKGWGARERAMTMAADALTAASAGTVAELPEAALAELRNAVEAAWG